MDFSTVKSIVIPEGSVTKITSSDGTILWQKATVSYDYSGTATASNSTYLTCNTGYMGTTSIESIADYLIVRQGSTTDGDIVVRIENGVATLGDGTTTTNFEMAFSGPSTQPIGVKFDYVYYGEDGNEVECYFNGTYNWYFNV